MITCVPAPCGPHVIIINKYYRQTLFKKARKQIKIMQVKQSKIEPVFNLVSEEGKNVKIVMGNNVVSNMSFDSEDDAENYIQSKPYELIFNACILFAQWTIKDNNHAEEKSINKKGNAAS